MNLTVFYHFYRKECKSESLKSLYSTCVIKKIVVNIKNLKEALNHGLVIQKVHGVIKINKFAHYI